MLVEGCNVDRTIVPIAVYSIVCRFWEASDKFLRMVCFYVDITPLTDDFGTFGECRDMC